MAIENCTRSGRTSRAELAFSRWCPSGVARLLGWRSPGDSLAPVFRRGPQPVLMLPHPVAVAPDGDDVAMVQQAVDERCRHDLAAEQGAAFFEAVVRGQHGRVDQHHLLECRENRGLSIALVRDQIP